MKILIAIALGCLTGQILGLRAEILGELSVLFIQVLKTLATPLVALAIIDGFQKTPIRARSAARLFGIAGINAVVAGTIALGVSRLFDWIDLTSIRGLTTSLLTGQTSTHESQTVHFEFIKMVKGIIPSSLMEPFLTNNVITVVWISVLFGLALRKMKSQSKLSAEAEALGKVLSAGLHLMQTILGWVIQGVPFAVFGVIAKVVGVSGFGFFSTLGIFVALVSLGMLIHIGVYYSLILIFVVRVSPIRFYREATQALGTALSTGSSLATLPVTLHTLQEKMKVSVESSRLAACIGTNLNHDGILLYEAVTALFVAHLSGVDLMFSQKALLLATSTLAAVGIAGVPDAGLITLSLVLGSVGLPQSFVPLLTSVDWLVGRFRAMVNVTSDMVVARVLDRLSK